MAFTKETRPEPLSSWTPNSINNQNNFQRLDKANAIASQGSHKLTNDSPRSSARPKLCLKGKPSSCVFVASLLATKTDSQLCKTVTERFKSFGDITSVKVLRDQINRPYAFVQFTNDADCQEAIRHCNNSLLDGRALRCEAAKVNRTIFVSLFRSLLYAQIEALVANYGSLDLAIASDRHGQPLDGIEGQRGPSRHWFIKFTYRDDAIKAFACLSDEGNHRVEWAQNIDDPTPKKVNFDKFTIFIGQLNPTASEDDVCERFSYHGIIKDISIIHKPSSSYAFVTFLDEAAAASAVAMDNHTMFMEKNINVQYRELSVASKARPAPSTPIALAPPPIRMKSKQPGRPTPTSMNPNTTPRQDQLWRRSALGAYNGTHTIPGAERAAPEVYRSAYRPRQLFHTMLDGHDAVYNRSVGRYEGKWPRGSYLSSQEQRGRDQDSIYYVIPE